MIYLHIRSAIYRIKLNYLLNDESKDATFIVKTGSETAAISEMLNDMGTLYAETHIYEKIVAECEEMFNFKLAPRLERNCSAQIKFVNYFLT